MILSVPMWWAYASLAPGLALAALIALIQGWRMLSGTLPPDDNSDPGAVR
jgi:TRAP-type C4-dicarboxylate transport system permease small subunit